MYPFLFFQEECSSASLKPKTTRNKLIGNSTHQVASSPLPQTAIPESGKQLSLYQNDMSWQQVQVAVCNFIPLFF